MPPLGITQLSCEPKRHALACNCSPHWLQLALQASHVSVVNKDPGAGLLLQQLAAWFPACVVQCSLPAMLVAGAYIKALTMCCCAAGHSQHSRGSHLAWSASRGVGCRWVVWCGDERVLGGRWSAGAHSCGRCVECCTWMGSSPMT
jgi:hypothetical protein